MCCFPATTVPVERGPGADTGLWFPDTHHPGNISTIRVGNQKQTVVVIALGVCAVEEERTGLKWILKMVIWTARR